MHPFRPRLSTPYPQPRLPGKVWLGAVMLVNIATIGFAQAPPSPTATATTGQNATTTAITELLHTQQTAWNEGDVDQFMEHYWKSDQLTFSAGGQVTRGWQATLDRYRERYPSTDAMGHLAFSGLEVTPLGSDAALVLGNWHLKRKTEGDVGGNFTLVLRKIDRRWVIVHDHTSRQAEEEASAPAASDRDAAEQKAD